MIEKIKYKLLKHKYVKLASTRKITEIYRSTIGMYMRICREHIRNIKIQTNYEKKVKII